MANEKITWSELRAAVARMSGGSVAESGAFLEALIGAVTEGLKEDKSVRIKGLGTFNLKPVAPRKSVNIATGETFVIEGYNKLTFNAEASLKESVEKRIETPKTEEMLAELANDPIHKLGQQADEIVDILADLGQSPKEKTEPVQEPESEEEVLQEEVQTIEEQDVAPIKEEIEEEIKEEIAEEEAEILEEAPISPQEKDSAEEQPTEIVDTLENTETTEEITHTTEQTMNKTEQATNEAHAEPKVAGKSKCATMAGWIVALVLLLILCGFIYYFRAPIGQWWKCFRDCQPPVTEEVTPMAEDVAEEPADTIVPLAEQPREYTQFIGEETVSFGSRLTWIAQKYYGEKDLWVFIYEANKSSIKTPNYLQYGQKIMVPQLDERLKDLSDSETRQLVDDLTKKYLQQQ